MSPDIRVLIFNSVQMKKRFFLLNICWAFISILNATQHRQAENPLVISTAEDLKAFAKSVNSGNSYQGTVVKLSADIWLNDTVGWQKWNRQTKMKSWTPIGIPRAPFEGTFDGDGHFIAGLFAKTGSETFSQGLIGFLKRATVKNVHIRFSHFISYDYVGALAGYISYNTQIHNCSNEGTIEAERNFSGGLVGFSSGQNRIISCSNYGRVYGHRCVGGIVGYFEGGSVYNTFNRGEIIGRYEHVGGIIGEFSEPYQKTVKETGLKELPNDTVANCYNTGRIIARDVAGGIAGHVNLHPIEITTWKVVFANNYNTGQIRTTYPPVTDGLVGVYAYFAIPETQVIPTIDRINRDGGPCFWSEESCRVKDIKKPRFESEKIRSESWNKIMYGVMKIPESFRYFTDNEMKQQSFVDLLNKWVDKKDIFSRWSLDKEGVNKGVPVFCN